jgi:hypothetical protein
MDGFASVDVPQGAEMSGVSIPLVPSAECLYMPTLVVGPPFQSPEAVISAAGLAHRFVGPMLDALDRGDETSCCSLCDFLIDGGAVPRLGGDLWFQAPAVELVVVLSRVGTSRYVLGAGVLAHATPSLADAQRQVDDAVAMGAQAFIVAVPASMPATTRALYTGGQQ